MNMDVQQMMMYDARKKSAGVAYLLWFLFGLFGGHRFYLDRAGSGFAILALTIGSFFVAFTGIPLLLVPIIWVFIDLFLIPGMTRDYNMKLAQQLLPQRQSV